MSEPAPIGHNGAPEPTPYEAMKTHIEDLYTEALGFLDGAEITTQSQADAVDKLKAMALEAEKDGDAKRKEEAKPFDEGKKEVQERWNPLVNDKTGKCRLIIQTCNKALSPFLIAKQKKIDDDAAEARRIADELEVEARKKLAAASPDNLLAREEAEQAIQVANKATTTANRAEKGRAQARGGGARATSLRTTYRAEITDYTKFAKWAWINRRDDMELALDAIAKSEATGPKNIDGLIVHADQGAF